MVGVGWLNHGDIADQANSRSALLGVAKITYLPSLRIEVTTSVTATAPRTSTIAANNAVSLIFHSMTQPRSIPVPIASFIAGLRRAMLPRQ